MRRLPLLVLVVAVLAGCGQSNPDLIPQRNAETLREIADRIQEAAERVRAEAEGLSATLGAEPEAVAGSRA